MNQLAEAKNWGNTLKIADTSAQDVQLAPKTKHKRNLIGGSALLFVLIIAWFVIPVVNRWANTTVTVPLVGGSNVPRMLRSASIGCASKKISLVSSVVKLQRLVWIRPILAICAPVSDQWPSLYLTRI